MNGYYDSLRVDTVNDFLYQPRPQRSPLTKQVDQLAYEIPNNKYVKNPWSKLKI